MKKISSKSQRDHKQNFEATNKCGLANEGSHPSVGKSKIRGRRYRLSGDSKVLETIVE